MNRSVNKVFLIGNVGSDVKYQFTPSGIPVSTFSLATSVSWKDKNGKIVESTDWHQIVAWRSLADIAHKLVVKGSKLYIEGKLKTRLVDVNEKSKRTVVEVVVEQLLLLDAKKKEIDFRDNDVASETHYFEQLTDIPFEETDDNEPF